MSTGQPPRDDNEIRGAVIEPLVVASHSTRGFFDSLPPLARGLVVLETLYTQVLRNGVMAFIEDEPRAFVEGVARACELLDELDVGNMFAAVERAVEVRDGRLRLDLVASQDASRALERYMAREQVDVRLIAQARASHALLAPHVERAAAICRERDELRALEAEAERARLEAARDSARTWTLRERFAVGEILSHAKFGLGEVIALAGGDKIQVRFADGAVRTLAHGR